MSDFDPDAYLKAKAAESFDPDAYLQSKGTAPAAKTMNPAEAGLHGAVESIPLGQKATALISALGLKAAKALAPEGHYVQQMDDTYAGQLASERAKLAQAEQDQKWATRGGKLLGGGLSMAALSPLKAAQGAGAAARMAAAGGNAGIYGALHGAGNADSLSDAAKAAAIEGGVSAGVGAGAQGLIGELAPALASKAGAVLKNAAGKLKVNSAHPTPTVAEAMESLPGGAAGVGEEVLSRNIGGLTKAGTAKQARAAVDDAGRAITALAKKADEEGGESVALRGALEAGREHAIRLQAEPTTRAAGERLERLVSDYEQIYTPEVGPAVPPSKVLGLKRALGKEAYGAGEKLAKTGEAAEGVYGQGVSKLERSVDDALDQRLGPEFADRNLAYRRLLGFSNAAERSAARTQGNHLLSLPTLMAGGAGLTAGAHAGHGGMAAAAAAALTHLAGKYGAQASGRAAYTIGKALEASPELLAAVPGLSQAAQSALTKGGESEALRLVSPLVAEGDQKKRSQLAQLLMDHPELAGGTP